MSLLLVIVMIRRASSHLVISIGYYGRIMGVDSRAAMRSRAQLAQKWIRLDSATMRGRDATLPGAAQLLCSHF